MKSTRASTMLRIATRTSNEQSVIRSDGMNLPMHGVTETLLEPEPAAATAALTAALDASGPARAEGLRRAVSEHPTFLDGWARLADDALAAKDPVAAYAFARTGYHRGL